jgi:hypothetical protein
MASEDGHVRLNKQKCRSRELLTDPVVADGLIGSELWKWRK